MIFRSIKWRLQLWHGLILVLVLSGFGYTAIELLRTREFRRVDQELQARVALLAGPPRRGRPPGLGLGLGPRRALRSESLPPSESGDTNEPEPLPEGPPFGPRFGFGPPEERARELERAFPEDGPFYFAIWNREGSLLHSRAAPPGLPAPVHPTPPGIFQRGEFRELHQMTPRGEAMVIGRSTAPELREIHKLSVLLFFTGLGILALGLAGGWVVATRAMRPIDAISATAQKIATGDLAQRITHPENESELGRLVAVLNSTFARLEAAFAEQVRFTTDVSHELRTPVTVMLSQTQVALSRERSALDYRETLEACQRAAQRMRRLIESLLQLARLDAGQEVLRSVSCDLATACHEAANLLQPIAEERHVKLALNLQAAPMTGDPDRLSQVATNLVSNAIHYTPRDGTVTLQTEVEGNLAVLRVSDTGIGIPPEDLPHIFERFYRVDTSRSRDRGGSGLGLAITRAIIHAHGGTIEVESQAGAGSRFTVRLPRMLEGA